MLGSSVAVAHKATRRAPTGKLARCWLVGIAIFIVFNCFEKTNSVADTTNNYRQWAFIQLNNIDEFYCLDQLYYAESRCNPRAVSPSGNHFGIPQGRSKWLSTVDGYKQVMWGIKYNQVRYGSMCKALQHYELKGWH
jgi:hypothetical protein